MKINPIFDPGAIKSITGAKPAAVKTKKDAARDETALAEDTVSFSKALIAAKEALEQRTPEEKTRIDEVTAAVRQGTYKIDSALIADRILESIFIDLR